MTKTTVSTFMSNDFTIHVPLKPRQLSAPGLAPYIRQRHPKHPIYVRAHLTCAARSHRGTMPGRLVLSGLRFTGPKPYTLTPEPRILHTLEDALRRAVNPTLTPKS